MEVVRLRPVRPADEGQFRAAHAQMLESDGFTFGLNYDPDEPIEVFIERVHGFSLGRGLTDGLVPATFLVAEVVDEIVGRLSIRHELNDFLAAEGGHIGYGVLPRFRRRGYATEILRQSLIIARSLGIENALLVCDDDNVGSATVIERCGGQLLDRVRAGDGTPIRRYEIGL